METTTTTGCTLEGAEVLVNGAMLVGERTTCEGTADAVITGFFDGIHVGNGVGLLLGSWDGSADGVSVGNVVGMMEGTTVGTSVGATLS